MPDFGNYADDTLPPAEKAVRYLLDRVRTDPDLRYLMLGTQAFAFLCEAEAHRSGKTRDEVGIAAAEPIDHRAAKRPARLASHRDLLECCNEMLGIWPLRGYELEAFCAATLIPMMQDAVKKTREE